MHWCARAALVCEALPDLRSAGGAATSVLAFGGHADRVGPVTLEVAALDEGVDARRDRLGPDGGAIGAPWRAAVGDLRERIGAVLAALEGAVHVHHAAIELAEVVGVPGRGQ